MGFVLLSFIFLFCMYVLTTKFTKIAKNDFGIKNGWQNNDGQNNSCAPHYSAQNYSAIKIRFRVFRAFRSKLILVAAMLR